MRAWLMDSFDGVEKLRLGDVPDPQPGPNQVLLRLRFAALNPADDLFNFLRKLRRIRRLHNHRRRIVERFARDDDDVLVMVVG